MLTKKMLSSLIYLDREFIAGRYENITGLSSQSQITKAQNKKAGASLPIFSAEISAAETRTFSVSTLEMLALSMTELEGEPNLNPAEFESGMSSKIGWINATLGTMTAYSSDKSPESSTYRKNKEQGCFTLRGDIRLALITTPDYFFSGMDVFLKMHKVLLRDLTIPVRALIRVMAAKNYMDDWIAIPYFIYEKKVDGIINN